jgi:hypothetical protein
MRSSIEWKNGEGETFGGTVVMRFGMNALNVIDGSNKSSTRAGPAKPTRARPSPAVPNKPAQEPARWPGRKASAIAGGWPRARYLGSSVRLTRRLPRPFRQG